MLKINRDVIEARDCLCGVADERKRAHASKDDASPQKTASRDVGRAPHDDDDDVTTHARAPTETNWFEDITAWYAILKTPARRRRSRPKTTSKQAKARVAFFWEWKKDTLKWKTSLNEWVSLGLREAIVLMQLSQKTVRTPDTRLRSGKNLSKLKIRSLNKKLKFKTNRSLTYRWATRL